ncbi:SNF2 family DNA-dependent ATPase [Mycena venus]|uniref:SNF2 family DNA-dependent ATPase n=1 Tax=Mycena venus TaxID=2733690 RepID=A0A8H7CSP6_9AGAR|nr:SNF2 family DNA-dependent ATPase [Mycena venus]
MSASPSPAPFALPSSSSASCSPLGTPARMWSSVPASTAASSPAPAPDTDAEDEEMPLKGEAEDNDNDDSSPFLRGVSLSDGEVARAVAWAEGDASKEQISSDPDASNLEVKAEDVEELEDETEEGELTASQLSRLEHVLERSALYSTILKQQMDDARKRHAVERAQKEKAKGKGKQKSKAPAKGRPAKRRKRAVVVESDESDEGDEDVNAVEEEQDATAAFFPTRARHRRAPQGLPARGAAVDGWTPRARDQWDFGGRDGAGQGESRLNPYFFKPVLTGIFCILLSYFSVTCAIRYSGAFRWMDACLLGLSPLRPSIPVSRISLRSPRTQTLQTIAFAAHLRENGTRPFLVVCPLSVMHNWVEEFRRFAPKDEWRLGPPLSPRSLSPLPPPSVPSSRVSLAFPTLSPSPFILARSLTPTPQIPVLMYHGTPAERAEMRRTTLALPDGWPSKSAPAAPAATTSGNAKGTGTRGRGRPRGSGRGGASSTASGTASSSTAKVPASPARRSGRNAAPPPASPSASRGTGRGRGGRGGRGGKGGGGGRAVAGAKRKRVEEEDEEQEDGAADSDAEDPDDAPKPLTKAERAKKALDDAHDAHFKRFPVVITTYDLIIKDRALIGGIPWGYIVVDEGHRLKNMNCALMREIKKYSSAGRMVLTGTPLHNNLAELWSLLNFILPDIFDDVYAFQEWFSLPRMNALLPSARMGTFISTLHTILKPFLLRRMKADVLGPLLPPKKSYVLYARLSARQREAYEAILAGGVRAWVAAGAGAKSSIAATAATSSSSPKADDTEEDAGRMLRTRKRKSTGKGKGKDAERDAEEEEEERRREAEAFARRGAAKHVNNMKLQNTVMQLRKVCSHPFLFAQPDDVKWSLGRAPPTAEVLAAREAELLGASGKMLLLDRLLGELFKRGHKVLLFSQFTTMLDIIEDWAVDMKGWEICRIDGTTPPLERRDQMNIFQSAGDAPDAPRLFLPQHA